MSNSKKLPVLVLMQKVIDAARATLEITTFEEAVNTRTQLRHALLALDLLEKEEPAKKSYTPPRLREQWVWGCQNHSKGVLSLAEEGLRVLPEDDYYVGIIKPEQALELANAILQRFRPIERKSYSPPHLRELGPEELPCRKCGRPKEEHGGARREIPAAIYFCVYEVIGPEDFALPGDGPSKA